MYVSIFSNEKLDRSPRIHASLLTEWIRLGKSVYNLFNSPTRFKNTYSVHGLLENLNTRKWYTASIDVSFHNANRNWGYILNSSCFDLSDMEIKQLQHIRGGIVDGKCNVIASIIGPPLSKSVSSNNSRYSNNSYPFPWALIWPGRCISRDKIFNGNENVSSVGRNGKQTSTLVRTKRQIREYEDLEELGSSCNCGKIILYARLEICRDYL